jgi:4-amino-4-deoxy-L-arabinose transferase-like glycosyltransferase
MTQSLVSGLNTQKGHRVFLTSLLLLTWGLRLCCLGTVPPGWRDDELINIHALSGELLQGRFPLYFTGASGHEPLYHYLLAAVHAVLGFNPLSAHILSAVLGTLTVALTYALSRRLFGRTVALIASLALTTSFWLLMYSRIALRHISLPPLALTAFLLLWRALESPPVSGLRSSVRDFITLGFALGASLYTYPAARLLPVMLIAFGGYLALVHRDRFRQRWRGLALAIVVAALVSVPLWIAIAQGRGEAAEHTTGVGADSRIAELAVPLRELQSGNPRPLLENVWTTLGMFHATGDPEWLYNISGRPVLNLPTGILMWAGVGLCLLRWRQPRYFFLLLWLGAGLIPTFVSIPPASLSHSILAIPVVYILPVVTLDEALKWLRRQVSDIKYQIQSLIFAICYLIFATFLAANMVRDVRDYFITWPRQEMVRVLYRADYRDLARYVNDHPEIEDVAVSSNLLGPWDWLALDLDIRRSDASVRLFDPERVLVWTGDDKPTNVVLVYWLSAAPPIQDLLAQSPPEAIAPGLTRYTLPPLSGLQSPASDSLARFANGLELIKAQWIEEPSPGKEGVLLTVWHVAEPLDLIPRPIVANPPPPGVYSGPRLAVFTHLLTEDGTHIIGDDGLWLDPHTLKPGDRFVQLHRYSPAADAPAGPYTVRVGLYDPKTGERWKVVDDSTEPKGDSVSISCCVNIKTDQ